MMLLHSGTFHQESWFPNCSNLVAWLMSDQVMLKAGTWWYQMPRCVSWWRRTSWPWKAPDQGTWTSMQNEDKQTMNNDRRGDAWKFMEILKVCVSICFSKRIFGFFGYAWDLGGAALLTYPVLRYSPVLCGHWKGGVWWALNWLRLKVLGIVCLFEYLFCWAIRVLYFSMFLHVFCVGLYDRVVAHCPKCFFCMSELIQSCRNGRSIHFATSTRLWPSHRRSSTAACLHFSLSQSVSITHVSGGFWTRMSRMWRDDSPCGHN